MESNALTSQIAKSNIAEILKILDVYSMAVTDLAVLIGLAKNTTRRYIKVMHDEKMIHIHKWCVIKSGNLIPSYMSGDRFDEPKTDDHKIASKNKRAAYLKQYGIENREKCYENMNKYREANWESVLNSSKISRLKNIEKARARDAEYYKNNREKCRAATKKWEEENADAVRVMRQNRRARKNSGTLSKDIVTKLLALQKKK